MRLVDQDDIDRHAAHHADPIAREADLVRQLGDLVRVLYNPPYSMTREQIIQEIDGEMCTEDVAWSESPEVWATNWEGQSQRE